MNDFQFPVFVRLKDCGDVRSYNSVADMRHDFEKIDVEYDEYDSWDVIGTPLKMFVQESSMWLRLETTNSQKPEQLAPPLWNSLVFNAFRSIHQGSMTVISPVYSAE